jgi:hypothetical protein
VQLEKAGVPTLTFVTDAFVPLAERVSASLDLPLPLLRTQVLPHAISNAERSDAYEAISQYQTEIERAIFTPVAVNTSPDTATANKLTGQPLERIELEGDQEAVADDFRSRGWLDGLPIVPPTEARVERMLGTLGPQRLRILGKVPPKGRPLTLESLAVCAVMAGCAPAYFPVVVAAARAMLRPEFNLLGVNTTTNAAAPLLIANGPIATEIGIQGGNDVFGPFHRPNITIGRAMRLMMIAVGDCRPGDGDMATHGQGLKAGICITECASPWEHLHVELGCLPDESTVTALSVTAQFNLLDFASRNADDLLHMIARTIATPGMQNAQLGYGPVIVFGIEHARMLANAGLTKQDVKRRLFEEARIPLDAFSPETVADVIRNRRPQWAFPERNPSGMVPMADAPGDFTFLVAGGEGAHSVLLPTFLAPRPVLVRVGRDGLGDD